MRAIVFEGQIQNAGNYPDPMATHGWARTKVRKEGICSAEYPFEERVAAFEKAKRPDTLTVLIGLAENG
jgi:hypothetical protein